MQMNTPCQKNQTGFTLVELAMVIAIAAVLFLMVIPSLSTFVWQNRITASSNDLMMTLLNARNTALKTGMPVVVCASTGTKTSGMPSCDGSSWNSGWISFIDFSRAGTSVTSSGILTMYGSFTTPYVSLKSSGSTTALRFLPTGQAYLGSTSTTTAAGSYLAVCDVTSASSTMAAQVTLLTNGRPQISQLTTCP